MHEQAAEQVHEQTAFLLKDIPLKVNTKENAQHQEDAIKIEMPLLNHQANVLKLSLLNIK